MKILSSCQRHFRSAIGLAVALGMSTAGTPARAQVCPFDDGNSSLAVEGLILTRYALGLTGAPLVAHTGINAVDSPTVEATINCPSCGLNITGNATMTVADATIISRKLAGISGTALTNGLNLGSGVRNSPAAVQSFLTAGCGAANAFVQGGNAFGVPALIGTTDAQPLRVVSTGPYVALEIAGGNGLHVVQTTAGYFNAPNVINGSANNTASGYGATVAGGGSAATNCYDTTSNTSTRSCGNQSTGDFSTVAGGRYNQASEQFATVGGGEGNTASGLESVVGGGLLNTSSGTYGTVAGGYKNSATSVGSTVGGGEQNSAGGPGSTVAGGWNNTASGDFSFAAGRLAHATHVGAWVWSDTSSIDFASVGDNTFNIRAFGGVHLNPTTSQFFGSQTRQMINLWGTQYGIGVQGGTFYFRSDINTPCCNQNGFSWHLGGSHNDGVNAPGAGGFELMRLANNGNLLVKGTVTASAVLNTSDRNAKSLFEGVNAKAILAKVAALPISKWIYTADAQKSWHVGPMAQDFRRAFGLGQDDKTIATVDADGIALVAIQGLHQIVKEKDARIAALEKKLAAIERRLGL